MRGKTIKNLSMILLPSSVNKLLSSTLYIIRFECNNEVIVCCSWQADKSLISLSAGAMGWWNCERNWRNIKLKGDEYNTVSIESYTRRCHQKLICKLWEPFRIRNKHVETKFVQILTLIWSMKYLVVESSCNYKCREIITKFSCFMTADLLISGFNKL